MHHLNPHLKIQNRLKADIRIHLREITFHLDSRRFYQFALKTHKGDAITKCNASIAPCIIQTLA